jgi:hypothetical protein
MSILWASLSDPAPFPPAARIMSLPALEAAAARCRSAQGIEAVRQAHLNAFASKLETE